MVVRVCASHAKVRSALIASTYQKAYIAPFLSVVLDPAGARKLPSRHFNSLEAPTNSHYPGDKLRDWREGSQRSKKSRETREAGEI